MKKFGTFDLSYLTIDSLSEGVGSSQITPLISRLSKSGLKINLISYEKFKPATELIDFFKSIGVNWNFRDFGSTGLIGGLERFNSLRQEIPPTNLIHARSDIPAVSGIYSEQGPVLWDVRSLWADQKVAIQKNRINKVMYTAYRKLENVAANRSIGMSTLTNAVIPILEKRNGRLPAYRTVVPTSVDLKRFELNRKMPVAVQALFSGTYNEYYDLELSAQFMKEFRKLVDCEIHWARPLESDKSQIQVGESKIELLQATSPDSAIAKFLEKNKEGMHHIAFDVEDIFSEIARLKGLGYVMIHDEPKAGADDKLIAFMHPKSSNGVLIELCQDRFKK
jgi:methylmalonyl-CoA/ethylmalonyl-CoA epimerase